MNVKLLSDRVLIDAEGAETKTDTGLIISKAKDPGEFNRGIVVAVGPGKTVDGMHHNEFDVPIDEKYPMQVRVDDKVVFQYGKEFHHEGKVYQLVNESDIIMVL